MGCWSSRFVATTIFNGASTNQGGPRIGGPLFLHATSDGGCNCISACPLLPDQTRGHVQSIDGRPLVAKSGIRTPPPGFDIGRLSRLAGGRARARRRIKSTAQAVDRLKGVRRRPVTRRAGGTRPAPIAARPAFEPGRWIDRPLVATRWRDSGAVRWRAPLPSA